MKSFGIPGLLVLICALQTGCMSKALWRSGNFIEPAPEPKLALYETDGGILAQYDAMVEHSGEIHRQSYFVESNLVNVANGQRPVFVKISGAALRPIPILPAEKARHSGLDVYAVCTDDPKSFTVYRKGWALGPCELPVFEVRGSTAARVALTPLTALGDATIVGGVIGAYAVDLWAQGGGTLPVHIR